MKIFSKASSLKRIKRILSLFLSLVIFSNLSIPSNAQSAPDTGFTIELYASNANGLGSESGNSLTVENGNLYLITDDLNKISFVDPAAKIAGRLLNLNSSDYYLTLVYSKSKNKLFLFNHGLYLGSVSLNDKKFYNGNLIDNLSAKSEAGEIDFYEYHSSILSNKRILKNYRENYSRYKKGDITKHNNFKIARVADERFDYNANKYDGTNAATNATNSTNWTDLGPNNFTATFADPSAMGYSNPFPANPWNGTSPSYLSFDGVNDWVKIPDTVNPSNGYTVEAWVRPTDVSNNRAIFYRTNGSVMSFSQQINITSAGKFQHVCRDAGTVTGTTGLVANTWYHVVIAATKSGTQKLYVNGMSEGTPVSVAATLWTGGTQYYIGESYSSFSNFQGDIAIIRGYSRELTAAEISSLYALGNTGTLSTKPVYITNSAAINGTSLTFDYDETLNSTAPATSAFTVNVNAMAATVNSVSISGSRVTLTLASAAIVGDTVTVAYTKPGTNNIKDTDSEDADNLPTTNVTNNSVDNTAPTISTLSPADNATAVTLTSNLVATFSENISAGTGTIILFKSDGTLVESYDITSSARLTFSGTMVTIDPTADLTNNTSYYVQISSNAIKDGSNNSFAGISDTTTWNFSTPDTSAPTIMTLSPADDANPVGVNNDLVITFSENVNAVAGKNITIKLSADDSVFEQIDASSSKVTSGGTSTITVNPAGTFGSTTGYYVQIDAGAFQDTSMNDYAGIADNTSWNFTSGDTVLPTVTDFSPDDNSGNVALSSDLVVTFSENVQVGTGNIVIYNMDASVFESIPVGSARVTFSNNTVTINPSTDLASLSSYYINIGSSAIKDSSNNNYVGISDSTTWNFTTIDATPPTISSTSPADGSTSVGINDNLIINFSEAVNGVSGKSIYIKKSSDDSVVETIAGDSSLISGNDTTAITINPNTTFTSGTDYYIQIDAGAFQDQSSNNFAGISNNTTWNFTTAGGSTSSSSTSSSTTGGPTIYIPPNPVDNGTSVNSTVTYSAALVGNILTVGFSVNLSPSTIINQSDFTVKSGSDTVEITSLSTSGNKLFLTLASAPSSVFRTTVSYVRSSGGLKDTSNKYIPNFIDKLVENFNIPSNNSTSGSTSTSSSSGTPNTTPTPDPVDHSGFGGITGEVISEVNTNLDNNTKITYAGEKTSFSITSPEILSKFENALNNSNNNLTITITDSNNSTHKINAEIITLADGSKVIKTDELPKDIQTGSSNFTFEVNGVTIATLDVTILNNTLKSDNTSGLNPILVNRKKGGRIIQVVVSGKKLYDKPLELRDNEILSSLNPVKVSLLPNNGLLLKKLKILPDGKTIVLTYLADINLEGNGILNIITPFAQITENIFIPTCTNGTCSK